VNSGVFPFIGPSLPPGTPTPRRASLLAGKLHALLVRPHLKGRDVYDLVWYLADPKWPPPNLEMLRNALDQTAWEGPRVTASNWTDIVARRLDDRAGDWNEVIRDVRPFLPESFDPETLALTNVRELLERRGVR
jgi:hypothetical protein